MKGLKNLIRLARITMAGKDDGNAPLQQMEYLGKVADGIIIFPYGYHANVPADVAALMLALQGSPDNRVAMPFNTKDRPTLKESEVVFFHPKTGFFLKWDENGDLIGDNGTGKFTLSGDTMTVDANLVVNGTMTNNGKDVGDTHGHTQGNDSGGDTEDPISGVT